MLVLNAYYSVGSMPNPQDPSKVITWDNIVFEGLCDDFVNNENMTQTSIFGHRFSTIKIPRRRFEAIFKGDITSLADKNVGFYYDNRKQLIQVSILTK